MKPESIDYETHLIGPEMIIPKPVCLSYCTEEGATGLNVGYVEMREYLKKLLSNKEILIVAQNATFELLVTYKYFPELRALLWKSLEEGRWICTQLQQQLIDYVSKKAMMRHSLAHLTAHYLKHDISATKSGDDAWRLRYSELENVPLKDWPEAAVSYAINDSVYALDVYRCQLKPSVCRHQLSQVEHLKASLTLNLMAARGILIDQDRVLILEQEVMDILLPIYQKLIDSGFMTQDVKTGQYKKQQKMLRAHVTQNIKFTKKTKKGAVSIAKADLEFYITSNPNDEILKDFRFIADYEKLVNSYTKRLKTAAPYIYTSYDAIKSTGRTSSRTSKLYPSVQIQNQPRGG